MKCDGDLIVSPKDSHNPITYTVNKFTNVKLNAKQVIEQYVQCWGVDIKPTAHGQLELTLKNSLSSEVANCGVEFNGGKVEFSVTQPPVKFDCRQYEVEGQLASYSPSWADYAGAGVIIGLAFSVCELVSAGACTFVIAGAGATAMAS